MSKEIPTPYVWSYQPQMGVAAGASQDYSTKMNWLSAGNSMIHHVNGIRNLRNQILMRQARVSATPRAEVNPRNWPARFLIHPYAPPMTVELPRNDKAEVDMTNSGLQLAGGGVKRYLAGIKPQTCSGAGIQLHEEVPSASLLRPDGLFQLAGGSRSSFSPVQRYLAVQTASAAPRSGGIGSKQFVQEFVPAVYINPFSGTPGTYPDAFISNYDYITDSVDGYD